MNRNKKLFANSVLHGLIFLMLAAIFLTLAASLDKSNTAREEAEKQKKSFYISGKIPEIILDFTAGCGVSLSEYALPENGEK